MKIFRYIIFILIFSPLSGCFVYQNISSWEEWDELSKQNLIRSNTASEIEFQLDKKQKFIRLPFLFINYSKRGNIYTPLLNVRTPIDKGKAITYFHFNILNSNDNVIFSNTVNDTLRFSALNFSGYNDYMAISTHMGRKYRIEELENQEDIVRVNYIVHILNQNGTIDSIKFQNRILKFNRTKRFGSFF